jgi:hypothetical protein
MKRLADERFDGDVDKVPVICLQAALYAVDLVRKPRD